MPRALSRARSLVDDRRGSQWTRCGAAQDRSKTAPSMTARRRIMARTPPPARRGAAWRAEESAPAPPAWPASTTPPDPHTGGPPHAGACYFSTRSRRGGAPRVEWPGRYRSLAPASPGLRPTLSGGACFLACGRAAWGGARAGRVRCGDGERDGAGSVARRRSVCRADGRRSTGGGHLGYGSAYHGTGLQPVARVSPPAPFRGAARTSLLTGGRKDPRRRAAPTWPPSPRRPRPDPNEHCSLGLNALGVNADEQVAGQS
jgi:hypothetical protein